MKFKVQASDLVEALSLAAVVKPTPVDSLGSTGFLCVVSGEKCFVYSEDERQKIRIPVDIFDVEGEGAFVFPAGKISALKYIDGAIEVEPYEDDGAKIVKYTTEGGTEAPLLSFDPKSLTALDKDFASAEEGPCIPVLLLKEAISSTKGATADASQTTKPHQQTLQLFSEGDGDGYMYATTGSRFAFFYSPNLKGKGLHLHQQRLPLLLAFLGKSQGEVQVFNSPNSTYFQNSQGHVIGWADQLATHKFGYYGLEMDKYILGMAKVALLQGLHWVKESLSSDEMQARLEYDHERQLLTLRTGENMKYAPISVVPLSEEESSQSNPIRGGSESKTQDFSFNVNVDWLLDMVSSLKGNRLELRVAMYDKRTYIVRIIETYNINDHGMVVTGSIDGEATYPCRVMRFIASKN